MKIASTATIGVTTFSAFDRAFPYRHRLRQAARNAVIFASSFAKTLRRSSGWIGFPYYHHVFDDERKRFERHLQFLRQRGDFITFDDAISLLLSSDPIDGRYFCLSFDDGFKNCATNALPILVDRQIPCAFFIAVNHVGSRISEFPNRFGVPVPVDFVTWEDCRQMLRAGMSIGSHTCSHSMLSRLSAGEVQAELRQSKQAIERELGRACRHFSAPFGKPRLHFNVDRDPHLAKSSGFASFATTKFGVARRGDSPFFIPRNRVVAAWGDYQFRHFFSL
jgi:peptidoglycan/xylan/chitin deacetylase (PgdA/CDA1 family)